jgi:hypothetical protein
MEYTGALYKVTVTEYDHGAQRVDPNDTKIFTTYDEAKAYQAHWQTGGDAGCFWRAEIESI